MPSPTKSRLELALAALLFSTGGAAIKAVAFTAWQVAGLRSGIAALALLLLVPGARRGWTWRAALVGIAYAGTLVLFVLANRLTTSANTIFLQSSAPLYLLVLSPWLLYERVERRDLVLMAAVGVGLALFFIGSERPVATAPDPVRGNLLAALSGVAWAFTVCGLRWLSAGGGGQPGGRKSGQDAEREYRGSAMAAVVSGNIIACVGCLPFALPLGTHGARDWTVIIYLGVFQIGLAYLLVTSALRQLAAFEASIILLIEPALNPLWAWAVHGEVPGRWALVGGVVILGATTVKTWLDTRAERQTRETGRGGKVRAEPIA
jgi:DME family drug/metabolite transporter